MEVPEVCMVVAAAQNGVIGLNGDMPWRRQVPEDMKMFVKLTMGHPVIMGRKTWESIPPKYRPLEGRTNIVLTRTSGYTSEGAVVAGSLREAVDIALKAEGGGFIFIIGGQGVYQSALDTGLVNKIYITRIHREFQGDTFLPDNFPNSDSWREETGETHQSNAGFDYTFITLTR